MLFELKLFPLHTVKQTRFGAYINSIQTEPSSIRINGEKQQKNELILVLTVHEALGRA